MIRKKICLMGDFAVGKTSLVRQFVDRQFSDAYLSTVGVKISRKLLDVQRSESPERTQLQLVLWDLEGSSNFRATGSAYLQGAEGVVVVADLTRQDTIASVRQHLREFLAVNPSSHAIIALNKSDIADPSDSLPDEVSGLRDRVLRTLRTSARTGENVDAIFEALGVALLEKTHYEPGS